MESLDLGLNFDGTHVLITGGAGYIGSAVVSAFLQLGASVTVLDIAPEKLDLRHDRLRSFRCDTSSEEVVAESFEQASAHFGIPTVCVALAALDLSVCPHHDSLTDMPLEQWRRTVQVNVDGTFLIARAWLRGIKAHASEDLSNVSLIIVGSESGAFGERGNADYASSKSAVQFGMVQSLMADAARVYPRARVSAVAPGPVDTVQFRRECKANPEQYWLDCQATTALGRPVPPSAVAKSIVFLASESWSGHITGQVLNVDSGKQGKVMFTKEEAFKKDAKY